MAGKCCMVVHVFGRLSTSEKGTHQLSIAAETGPAQSRESEGAQRPTPVPLDWLGSSLMGQRVGVQWNPGKQSRLKLSGVDRGRHDSCF